MHCRWHTLIYNETSREEGIFVPFVAHVTRGEPRDAENLESTLDVERLDVPRLQYEQVACIEEGFYPD